MKTVTIIPKTFKHFGFHKGIPQSTFIIDFSAYPNIEANKEKSIVLAVCEHLSGLCSMGKKIEDKIVSLNIPTDFGLTGTCSASIKGNTYSILSIITAKQMDYFRLK